MLPCARGLVRFCDANSLRVISNSKMMKQVFCQMRRCRFGSGLREGEGSLQKSHLSHPKMHFSGKNWFRTQEGGQTGCPPLRLLLAPKASLPAHRERPELHRRANPLYSGAKVPHPRSSAAPEVASAARSRIYFFQGHRTLDHRSQTPICSAVNFRFWRGKYFGPIKECGTEGLFLIRFHTKRSESGTSIRFLISLIRSGMHHATTHLWILS